MPVRILIFGNPDRGDDGAALAIAAELPPDLGEVRIVGRGDLLDHLDPAVPTVVVDVVQAGLAPGEVCRWSLAEAAARAVAGARSSTHALGPGPALRLARALGRTLPIGAVVGIEGRSFAPGAGLGPEVAAGLDALRVAVIAAAQDIAGVVG